MPSPPHAKTDVRIGCVFDPLSFEHSLAGHPENAERLTAIRSALEHAGLWDALVQVEPRAATTRELRRGHSQAHVEHVEQLCRSGGGMLDPDTYATPRSFDAAARAVGGLVDLCLAVCAGELRGGFALLRPPGHHATHHRAMGFCVLGNVALAALAARDAGSCARVAIVDFDVHHGNGTEEILHEDPHVLFVSSHQYPHYPGTGALGDIGRGPGEGTTVNVPLPVGTGDRGFSAVYERVVGPALRRFAPELILVSAGYDAHWRDPLAGLSLSLQGYAEISTTLVALADELCAGRIVFSLEGGYDQQVLGAGVCAAITALRGGDAFVDPVGPAPAAEPDLSTYLTEATRLHGLED